MLIASRSKDVERVKQEKDDHRMLGIAEELARTARRRRVHAAAPKQPTGEFTFGSYKAFPVANIPGVSPGEDKALALLHRLATDPGIVGIMAEHRYALLTATTLPSSADPLWQPSPRQRFQLGMCSSQCSSISRCLMSM